MLDRLKRMIGKCTGKTGNFGTMQSAFRGIERRKHTFRTVIDVGAADGHWTEAVIPIFPSCRYLLIEAQSVHRKALEKFSRKHPQVQFVLAAAGTSSGKVVFNVSDPFGGQASYQYQADSITWAEVPATTIDHEVESRSLPGPYLIKLDTHGFEVPILKGASQTLADTETIIMECYNFKISPECLLFFEMCRYMKEAGFRCVDLVQPLYRPHDGAFWQMDLVFIREDRPEFSYMGYR